MQLPLFNSTTVYGPDAFPSGALLLRDPAGQLVQARDQDILTAARMIADQALPRNVRLDSPGLVEDFMRLKLNSALEYEVFGMVLLNAQHELIEYQEPFRGTLTQASVYPREVARIALKANAGAIIIAHNHPSGALVPSEADKALTAHLRNTLQLIDVRLLDHILVAGNQTLSFGAHGLL
ncbi:JAB domain-containing protein [Pollutimonas bauzanensis]|uniref:DNA repair protein RadC n=1 Tax=Pollutimonas bauzanensis TaxID=658167 RepID=A0A1M5YJE3_9BURK|nr:JAB domain-containing protein [Pollutimonas bauzanensis]SHI12147.1 DNA repair protein RadC [Pollutimonas bauzanensis]